MNRGRDFPFGAFVLVLVGLCLCPLGLVLADCNSNGLPDECDIACGEPGGACDLPGCGQSSDCNSNGVPDECESVAVLTLHSDETAYPEGIGATITVTVALSQSSRVIVGGQFFLKYDQTLLDFVSMVPGSAPFTREVYEVVNEASGAITYAIGVPNGIGGTSADTVMATITFRALVDDMCEPGVLVWFDAAHYPPTRLTDDTAAAVSPVLGDLSPITICKPGESGELFFTVADGSECVTTADPITVTLDVANLSTAINGVQALVHYDTARLTLVGITPATGWVLISPPNPNSPDPDGDGLLACALYLPGGSISDDSTVATFLFSPVAEGATNVIFQADDDPFFTKLTVAGDSTTILPYKVGSGTISIDNTVATAGSNSPVCEGDTIELYGGPDTGSNGPYTYAWVGTNGFSSSEQNPTISEATLDMNGTYTLTVTNASGCEFVAQTDVTVQLCLTVNVEIQGLVGDSGVYGPPFGGSELVREVTFVLTDCGDTIDTRQVQVTFTADTIQNKGVGSVTFTGLDSGIEWLSVQEGHTLRKLVEVDFVTTLSDSVMVFLPSGDFHTALVGQDNLVDITDFSILASSWESGIDAGAGVGGDATGDGYHDADDFALIQPNFLLFGDDVDGCDRVGRVPPAMFVGRVPPAAMAPASPPVRSVISRAPRAGIPVSELSLTVAYAERADLDGNGIVDVRDIRAFAERYDLPLLPQFETRLVELEAELAQLGPALEVMPHHKR